MSAFTHPPRPLFDLYTVLQLWLRPAQRWGGWVCLERSRGQRHSFLCSIFHVHLHHRSFISVSCFGRNCAIAAIAGLPDARPSHFGRSAFPGARSFVLRVASYLYRPEALDLSPRALKLTKTCLSQATDFLSHRSSGRQGRGEGKRGIFSSRYRGNTPDGGGLGERSPRRGQTFSLAIGLNWMSARDPLQTIRIQEI